MTSSLTGLIVLTEHLANPGVVLQVRDQYEFEENASEKLSRGCRITVFGQGEVGETCHEAMLRITKENLGDGFASLVRDPFRFKMKRGVVPVVDHPENRTLIFGLMVPEVELGRIPRSAGEFHILPADEVRFVKNLRDYSDGQDVPQGVFAMLPSEHMAVIKALDIFSGR